MDQERNAPVPAPSAGGDLRRTAEPAIKRNPNGRGIPIEGIRDERGKHGKQEDATMHANPLKKLRLFGQFLWLDSIRRDMIAGALLRRLIEEDVLRRMTSNSYIFEKAIVDSHEDCDDIRIMTREGKGVHAIYETLSRGNVQSAADKFRSAYDETDEQDGYLSLEVNLHLGHDANDAVEEAGSLRQYVPLRADHARHEIVTRNAGLLPPNHYVSVAIFSSSTERSGGYQRQSDSLT
ncbi:MAG: transaldolase family protein [Nitrospirota bacterium]